MATLYSQYRDARANKYKLVLTYFDGRGRCEHIRLLFAAAKRDYEDRRISSEWGELKPKTPFGYLPLLEADGQMINGSGAIGRMVAKICNLDGANYLEQGLVDMFVDVGLDIREAIFNAVQRGQKEPENAEKFNAEMMEKVTPMLKNLEKLLGDNDFFVANKLSYADIQFFASMEVPFLLCKMTSFLDEYPKLKALYERVKNFPAIAEYLKTRPETMF